MVKYGIGIGRPRLGLNDRDPLKWSKIIILRPGGDNYETEFSMGYIAYDGQSEVCDAIRKVGGGPFGMRMGPENCRFFIATNNNSKLTLASSRLTNGGYIEVY